MNNIHFFFHQTPPFLKDKRKLKSFIGELFKREKKNLESLSYIFCKDEYLLGINQQFLKHDYYTDIITFNLAKAQDIIEGEIYISVDRVKENAQTEAVSFTNEIHRVIFHGALHLCGFRDKIAADKRQMRNKENKYLKLFSQ
jgi:probable rRNA maturation factor